MGHVVENGLVPERSLAPVAVVEVVNVAVAESEAEAVNDLVIENEAVVGKIFNISNVILSEYAFGHFGTIRT